MNLDPIGWNMAYLGLTTVVVWSVSRYYRRKVDFTKLKKYLDLKEKNLEQEFEKKIQTLNDASIHIDVDAKRYNQLTHVVQGDLLTIEKRLSVFAEIDKRIEGKLDTFRREEDRIRALSDEFAGQLRELSEKQDDFRKLQKDLKKGEDRLAELEQASGRFIQELKEIHAKEQAALEARLEKEVSATRADADEKLAALRGKLDDEARSRAEEILQEARTQAEANLEASRAAAEANLAESRSVAKILLEETRAHSQKLSSEVDAELARLGERTLVLAGEIEASREEIIHQNAHVSETILKDLVGKVQEYQRTLGDDLAARHEAADKRLAELDALVAQAEARVVAAADAKLADIQGGLSQFEARLEEGASETTRRYEEIQQGLLRESREALDALRHDLAQAAVASAENDERLGLVEEKAERLDAGVSTFEGRLAESLSRQAQEWERLVAERIQQVERGLHPRLRELEERAGAAIDAFTAAEKKNLELVFREAETGARARLDGLERDWTAADANLKNLDEQFFLLRDAMDRAEKQLDVEGWVRAATEALREEAGRQKDEVAASFTGLEARAKRLEAALDTGLAERTEEAVARLETLRGDFTQLGGQVAEARQRAESLEGLAEGLQEQRKKVAEGLASKFDAGLQELLGRLKAEEARLKAEYEKAADHRKKELLMAFEDAAGEYRALFQSGRGRADQKIDRLLGEMEQRLERSIAAWQEEKLPAQQAALDRASTSFLDAFRERLGALDQEAAAFRSETRAQWEGRLGEEANAFAQDVARRKAGLDAAAQELGRLKDEFDGARRAFDAENEALRGEFLARQGEIEREASAYRAQTREQYEARLAAEVQDFSKEAAARREALEAAAAEFDAVANHLGETRRALDADAEGLREEFRQKQDVQGRQDAEERAKSRGAFESRLTSEVEAFGQELARRRETLEEAASDFRSLKKHLDETRSAVEADAEILRADLRGRQDGWLKEEHAFRADFQKAYEARLGEAADRFNAEVARKEGELARLADQWKRLEAVRQDFEKRLDKWNHTMVRGEKTLEEVSRRLAQKASQVEGEVLGARESARVQMAASVEAMKVEAKAEVKRAAELQVAKVERRLASFEEEARRQTADTAHSFGKAVSRQQKDLLRLSNLALEREKLQARDLEARKEQARAFFQKVEEEQKKIHQVVTGLPEQFRREIRETLERERAAMRGEIGQFGREIRLEAERRLGEAGASVLTELEREKLDLRKAFEQLAQYAQQDRDIFQNRLLQYRAELEENIRHLLDHAGAPQGGVETPMLSFDARPAVLTEGQVEGARERWHEELSAVDERIKTLTLKKDRRYEQIEEQMKEAFGKVEKRLGQFASRMDDAEQKVEKRAKRRFLLFLERLKQSADKAVAESGRKQVQLDEMQASVADRMKELEQWSREHRAQEGELLAQFEREAGRLRGELQSGCDRFLEAQQGLFHKAMEASAERLAVQEADEAEARARREAALAEAMDGHAQALARFLGEQEAAVAASQAKLERLESEYGAQAGERFAREEKRLDAFILEKQRAVDGGLSEMRERLALETEDRFKAVNEQIRVILDKMDLFLGQTDLFKKVDVLQERMAGDLEAYEKKVAEIRGHLESAAGFEEKFESFRRLEAEVREGMEALADKQKNLGRMEDQLVYLVKMSEDLRSRGEILETRRTELVKAEETLSRHLGEAARLSETFKNFLGMKGEIDEVLGAFAGVRKQASEARTLQGQLSGQIEASAGLQRDVHQRLADLEEKSMVIASQQGRLVEFKNRFDQLDMAFQDMEQRQNVLNRARGELAAQKEELQVLRDQVEREIEAWKGMMQQRPRTAPEPVAVRRAGAKGGETTPAQNAQIAEELHKLDWKIADIADHLEVDEREVRRLLGIRAGRGEDQDG
ncbi:MAG: hypothetical protein J0L75_09980 [Spirochaetes bacterium]|nr:hypothetical protein [Spirochaetota bacterium]